jgi:hypothetical protein
MADELPLIHTSRCEFLNAFATSHTIEPHQCDVFNEDLIYLFYGRPAYRSRQGSQYGDPIALCPLCFVFKPRTISRSIHRIFPCDSGAVSKSTFEPELHPNDLHELELDPVIASAQRLVSLIFQSNKDYFYGRVKPGIAFPNGTASQRYSNLLLRPGPVDFDDRKSAIEVQLDQTISLKGQLMFVVLPREFLEDPMVRDTISTIWGCDAVQYPTFRGDAPTSYYSVVRNEVSRLFESKGEL